jgi:hypothetical protein
MKLTIIPILILLTVAAFGQGPTPPVTRARQFRWSESSAHELDYRQTIRKTTQLASDERASLLEVMAEQIRPFKSDLEISSEIELRQVVLGTRIQLIDLNHDGIAEVLAQANGVKEGCGATGNCPFWVFQKTSSGFKKLLDTRDKDGVGGIEVITVSSGQTNGFNDLVLGTHDSVSERTLYEYRYRTGQYQMSDCYEANWSQTVEEPKLKCHPEITPCK